MKSIEIHGTEKKILSVSLQEILNFIQKGHQFNWSILWLEAYGDLGDESILDFEKRIKQSETGLLISWENLLEFSNKLNQILEIVIIGDMLLSNIKRYIKERDMYLACDYTIELIDSSYWVIHSKDVSSLENMANKLDGVRILDDY